MAHEWPQYRHLIMQGGHRRQAVRCGLPTAVEILPWQPLLLAPPVATGGTADATAGTTVGSRQALEAREVRWPLVQVCLPPLQAKRWASRKGGRAISGGAVSSRAQDRTRHGRSVWVRTGTPPCFIVLLALEHSSQMCSRAVQQPPPQFTTRPSPHCPPRSGRTAAWRRRPAAGCPPARPPQHSAPT